MGHHPRAGGRRDDDPAVHPVPRGGRPAGRRDRGDRPRPRDRRGHARAAQGVRRLGRAARAPAGPGAAPAGRAGPAPGARDGRAGGRRRRAVRRVRGRRPRRRAVAALARSGVRIAEFSLGQPSLDEVFLALTGHPAEERPTTQTTPPRRSRPHEHPRRHAGHRPPGRRSGRRPPGDRLHRPPAAGERDVGRAHLRVARDAEGQARARAAPRRDDHAGDVRAHVHLPVRRRDRRVDRRRTWTTSCPASS